MATFYDSHTYIELLEDGEIEIHLDIDNIINANGESSFAVVDRNSNYRHVCTFADYAAARELAAEEEYFVIVDATSQYDIYL